MFEMRFVVPRECVGAEDSFVETACGKELECRMWRVCVTIRLYLYNRS